jgi:hypothetical protein
MQNRKPIDAARLLCTRGDRRERCRRAAKNFNEIAPSHLHFPGSEPREFRVRPRPSKQETATGETGVNDQFALQKS